MCLSGCPCLGFGKVDAFVLRDENVFKDAPWNYLWVSLAVSLCGLVLHKLRGECLRCMASISLCEVCFAENTPPECVSSLCLSAQGLERMPLAQK